MISDFSFLFKGVPRENILKEVRKGLKRKGESREKRKNEKEGREEEWFTDFFLFPSRKP